MSTKPGLNVNTILTSLTLIGIVWLCKSVATLQSDMAVLKERQSVVAQNQKDFDHRIRDLEFKKHGDGL